MFRLNDLCIRNGVELSKSMQPEQKIQSVANIIRRNLQVRTSPARLVANNAQAEQQPVRASSASSFEANASQYAKLFDKQTWT
jgi:hypothetical protein